MKLVFGRCSLLMAILGLAACQQPTGPEAVHAPSNEASSESLQEPGTSHASASRFIVVLRQAVDPAPVARAHGVTPHFTYSKVLNGFAADLPDAARRALERHPWVERIEPDAIVTTQQDEQGKGGSGDGGSGVWGLDRIDQRPLKPLQAYSVPGTGAGVTAYIVDTGIRYDHEEFGGRASFGFDIRKGRHGDGSDCHGHGTHVAGTLGGATYGVAKSVQLVSVRVLDCDGSGTLSGVIAGLDWIAKNARRPTVVNMSLGGGRSEALNDAVENLIASGVPVAVAAGNSKRDACTFSPASAPSAMTVGATDDADARAGFSNWGPCLDWFAPGVNIPSAWHTSPSATRTGSGTSMAAPHAAGVAALYLERHPAAGPRAVRDALLEFATKCIVQDSRSDHWHLLYALEEEDPWDCGVPPPNTSPLLAPTDMVAEASTVNVEVSVSWRNPNDHADSYEFQWRALDEDWSPDRTITGVARDIQRVRFGSGYLKPSTTYEFRARLGITYDGGRWSEWSQARATTCDSTGKSGKCQ